MADRTFRPQDLPKDTKLPEGPYIKPSTESKTPDKKTIETRERGRELSTDDYLQKGRDAKEHGDFSYAGHAYRKAGESALDAGRHPSAVASIFRMAGEMYELSVREENRGTPSWTIASRMADAAECFHKAFETGRDVRDFAKARRYYSNADRIYMSGVKPNRYGRHGMRYGMNDAANLHWSADCLVAINKLEQLNAMSASKTQAYREKVAKERYLEAIAVYEDSIVSLVKWLSAPKEDTAFEVARSLSDHLHLADRAMLVAKLKMKVEDYNGAIEDYRLAIECAQNAKKIVTGKEETFPADNWKCDNIVNTAQRQISDIENGFVEDATPQIMVPSRWSRLVQGFRRLARE